MNEEITSGKWYDTMIEECRAIKVEHEFTSRWALVEGYHALGKRILEEHENFERSKIYGGEIVQRVAESLGMAKRSVWYAIQFVRKYPDLDTLPEGKNVNWHKITQKYLPESPDGDKEMGVESGLVAPDFRKVIDDVVTAAANLTELLDLVSIGELREDEKDYLFSQLRITVGKVGRFLLNNDKQQ